GHVVLSPLLELHDVMPALDAARSAVDAALRHRAMRRSGGPLAAEIGLRSAVASAALEGSAPEGVAPYALDDVRAGTVTDPVVQGALRVSAALDGLAPRWRSAPRQVLAKLHVLAARGVVPDDALGRPTSLSPPVSPPRKLAIPTAELDLGARLDLLCTLISSD